MGIVSALFSGKQIGFVKSFHARGVVNSIVQKSLNYKSWLLSENYSNSHNNVQTDPKNMTVEASLSNLIFSVGYSLIIEMKFSVALRRKFESLSC